MRRPQRRRFARWLVAASLAAAVAAPAHATQLTDAPQPIGAVNKATGAAADDVGYVMGYFKESLNGSGDVNALHLALSPDGLEWTPLNDNKAVLTPTAGTKGLRDPFLYRLNDGTWVAVATDIPRGGDFAKPNPNIHVWTSPDLVNWSADRLLNVNRTNPNSYSWAPAVHWDQSRQAYGITYSTVPEGGRYSVIAVAYTTDFLTTTAPTTFFDGGPAGVIDSHVVTDVNGMNYLYYKDHATGGLVGARSPSSAPGSFRRYGGTLAENPCTEAPTLVKSLTSGTWQVWGDTFCPNARFDVWEGDLASASWTKLDRRRYTAPLNAKHNTIQTVTAAEYDRLLRTYGGTEGKRLKSYNFPGHFVRHANFEAGIAEQPSEPHLDSVWRLTPGLAGADGVSFESVSFPGHYLRHQGFQVKLLRDDGTAQFARDATFRREPGLADPNWSSFRSVNHPARHLRHVNFALRLDEAASAGDRADATFRIGY